MSKSLKVLLITLAWPQKNNSNLYKDLMIEFVKKGHDVSVLTTLEKRFGDKTSIEFYDGITIYRASTGNITKTKYIEKTISLIRLKNQLIAIEKKHFTNNHFDLIIISTPSITISGIVKYLKNKHNAFIYLLLKDIWPQGAVDLGVIKERGLIWNYFRIHEKNMYKNVDKIGCMSPYAVNFIIRKNSYLQAAKVEVCPNSIFKPDIDFIKSNDIYLENNIPTDKLLIIYGGNLSISHGIDFYLDCIKLTNSKDVHFIIIGSGTHYKYVENSIQSLDLKNVTLIEKLPYLDYIKILQISDIGIVLLNSKYTVPQFPSKINDYLSLKIPIIAITNNYTDAGKIIESYGAGFNITSYKTEDFRDVIYRILNDKKQLGILKDNSIKLYNKLFRPEVSYTRIIDSYNEQND